ncbi:hypothetical protein MSAN_01068500 [Mycena sanguinolenta]|uniref:DUF6534 domain-containing protein n=1 Tax=Mycena sanguinolenta TaxID=230812 RepID=A0A8H6YMY8_9AGAR|nr:hypothetical protein MSAN_01068500 [Mycena sanguinolenta]
MSLRLLTRDLSADSYVLAGWDLAICIALFFQGVLCAQFAHYINLSKRDTIGLKFLVAGLALMTAVRCCECLATMWLQNVTLFVNVEAALQLWRHWVPDADIMLEATGAVYVQIFFCRRLWASILCIALSAQHSSNIQAISRNAYIVIICLIFFALGFVSSAIATWFVFAGAITTTAAWVSLHFGIALCADFLLTGSTVFYLLRHYNASVLSRSPFAIRMKFLVRLTIQSAAPAAICTLANFVADMRLYLTDSQDPQYPQSFMVGRISILILPQLYAWSAMWTLNSREDIWATVDNPTYTVNLATSAAVLTDLQPMRGPHVGKHDTVPLQRTQNNSVPLRKVERFEPIV